MFLTFSISGNFFTRIAHVGFSNELITRIGQKKKKKKKKPKQIFFLFKNN